MSPTPPFQDHHHAKKDNNYNNNNSNSLSPSPLKINKDSHIIKKSPQSSSSSSSSGAAAPKPQQRHPVIIYTHSPKIIHTHPRDFMALVQKLTGMSRSSEEAEDGRAVGPKTEQGGSDQGEDGGQKKISNNNKKWPSSSLSTGENESTDENGAPFFDHPDPYFNNIPFYPSSNASSSEFRSATTHHHQSYYNYPDSMFLMPIMRSSISSSSSTLEGMTQFLEY